MWRKALTEGSYLSLQKKSDASYLPKGIEQWNIKN